MSTIICIYNTVSYFSNITDEGTEVLGGFQWCEWAWKHITEWWICVI